MRNRKILCLSFFCSLLAAMSLSAQATRTWVSGIGDDANPCTRTAPCRTFEGALARTAACGEISVMDAGGFGTVTITKSVTIDGSGTNASILNGGGLTGIVVNLAASDSCNTVVLRNLSIQGGGQPSSVGLAGIRFIGSVVATNLIVQHVAIVHQQRGIDVQPGITNHRLFLKDVDVDRTTVHGIHVRPDAGKLVRLHFHDVRSRGSLGDGLQLANNIQGTIHQSQFEANGNNGVNAASNSVFVTLTDTVMANNLTNGLLNSALATVIDGCTMAGNLGSGAFNNSGAGLYSKNNNGIALNSTDVTGTITVIPPR
jgi:hypothetical protein